MFGLPFGMMVEGSVSILLAVTIAYCVVLNGRLKRLHADREVMGVMVADLVQATDLANRAVGELKASAVEADLALKSRLEEAEHFWYRTGQSRRRRPGDHAAHRQGGCRRGAGDAPTRGRSQPAACADQAAIGTAAAGRARASPE